MNQAIRQIWQVAYLPGLLAGLSGIHVRWGIKQRQIWQVALEEFKQVQYYRTLHSYKLFWAVCHLFPQRWRMLTYSVSGNRWPGGPRDMFKTRSAHKFKSCVFEPPTRRVFSINTSSSNTLVLFDQISPQQQHTPFSVNTGEKSNTMHGPHRHSYTMTMRRFPVSEKLPVSNHKKRTF